MLDLPLLCFCFFLLNFAIAAFAAVVVAVIGDVDDVDVDDVTIYNLQFTI